MIATLMHLPLAVQVIGVVAGVAALAAGGAWAVRAAVRYVTAREGQNWETVLLLGFFAAAAAQSAGGLLGFAKNNMKLDEPMAVVFWLALDGAAGMLLSMVRRRARAGRSTWHVRAVVWLIIVASARFNWLHAPHLPSAPLAFAAMPVIAGILAEMAVADIRAEQREEDQRKNGPSPVRRVELARWLHPLESVRVMSVMAADAAVSAADATREVRADAAARALYRLRVAITAEDGAEDGATGKTRRGKLAVRIAELAAQSALRRAGFATADVPEEILRRVQVLVLIPDFATLDFGTADQAKNAIESLISSGKPSNDNSGTGGSGATGTGTRRVLSLAIGGGTKEKAARQWWSEQEKAGRNLTEITGPEINKAAGASAESSFGRQFRSKVLAEMAASAGTAGSDADKEVTG